VVASGVGGEKRAAAATALLGVSRCYKCSWPWRLGETCPNCSSDTCITLLPGPGEVQGELGAPSSPQEKSKVVVAAQAQEQAGGAAGWWSHNP
jgi:hypothetical protein